MLSQPQHLWRPRSISDQGRAQIGSFETLRYRCAPRLKVDRQANGRGHRDARRLNGAWHAVTKLFWFDDQHIATNLIENAFRGVANQDSLEAKRDTAPMTTNAP